MYVGALPPTAPAACSWLSIAAGLLIATRLNNGKDKVELFRRCTGVCGGETSAIMANLAEIGGLGVLA